jgi:hypothetical protein
MDWLCRRCGETITRPLCPRINCPTCGRSPIWQNAHEYDGPEFWKHRDGHEAGDSDA